MAGFPAPTAQPSRPMARGRCQTFHLLISNQGSIMQLKYKETSTKSVDALAAFLAKLVAQRSETQREAKSAEADLLAAERIELTEHTAQQSIRDASGWGGGNGVNLPWGTRPSAGRQLLSVPARCAPTWPNCVNASKA